MSYTKQNFEDGQVLTAEHLNNMEDGIKAVSEEIANYSWDDLKDKPFGEDETVILPQSDVQLVIYEDGTVGTQIESSVPLQVGDTLCVTWDGIKYNSTIFMFYDLALFGNGGAFGLVDSGEPFLGKVDDDGALLIMDLTTQESVVRSMAISKVSVTKMPTVYLPGAVTMFYFSGNDSYMYSDIGCTTKATRAELHAAISNGIVCLFHSLGAMRIPSAASTATYDYGVCQTFEPSGGTVSVKNFYTAEYTAT